MAEEIMEGVNPTRMELLGIRKKLNLADKGHNLLEEKRDSLVERFFKIIDKRNDLSGRIDKKFQSAFSSLIEAQMIMGEDKVEEMSYLSDEINEFSLQSENIMGVKIPNLDTEKISFDTTPNYGFFETCSKLDDAQLKFKDLLKDLIELADLEAGIKSLSIEIEKTKRRVNVLENNLIPKLKATRKYIEMQLEEREREDFIRRKRIKSMMEEEKKKKQKK
ncbi:MAG: V-type ATP synthase subunit D [Candidatus Thermoplasmatota archaeon]